jgi:hypothetical protein
MHQSSSHNPHSSLPSSAGLFKSVKKQGVLTNEEIQNKFFAALSKCEIEEIKKLSPQVNLTLPSSKGKYPLEIAIYSTNLEVAEYIISELDSKGVLKPQWKSLDREKVQSYIKTQIPVNLSSEATYFELGNWYSQNADKAWVRQYDKEIEKEMEKESKCTWANEDWKKRKPLERYNEFPFKHPITYYKNTYLPNSKEILMDAPSRLIHDKIVKNIADQLIILQAILDQSTEELVSNNEINKKSRIS